MRWQSDIGVKFSSETTSFSSKITLKKIAATSEYLIIDLRKIVVT
jgi:hypothetical protein